MHHRKVLPHSTGRLSITQIVRAHGNYSNVMSTPSESELDMTTDSDSDKSATSVESFRLPTPPELSRQNKSIEYIKRPKAFSEIHSHKNSVMNIEKIKSATLNTSNSTNDDNSISMSEEIVSGIQLNEQQISDIPVSNVETSGEIEKKDEVNDHSARNENPVNNQPRKPNMRGKQSQGNDNGEIKENPVKYKTQNRILSETPPPSNVKKLEKGEKKIQGNGQTTKNENSDYNIKVPEKQRLSDIPTSNIRSTRKSDASNQHENKSGSVYESQMMDLIRLHMPSGIQQRRLSNQPPIVIDPRRNSNLSKNSRLSSEKSEKSGNKLIFDIKMSADKIHKLDPSSTEIYPNKNKEGKSKKKYHRHHQIQMEKPELENKLKLVMVVPQPSQGFEIQNESEWQNDSLTIEGKPKLTIFANVSKPKKEIVPKKAIISKKGTIPEQAISISKTRGHKVIGKPGKKDFIRDNFLAAIRVPPKIQIPILVNDHKGYKPAWAQPVTCQNYVYEDGFGEVPLYLKEYKAKDYRQNLQLKYIVGRVGFTDCNPIQNGMNQLAFLNFFTKDMPSLGFGLNMQTKFP